MVRLSRYDGLPWDIILGSSISGFYKPHPQAYLQSIAALNLQPEQVCMAAAEIHPEGDWTYLADDFLDLARQLKKDY